MHISKKCCTFAADFAKASHAETFVSERKDGRVVYCVGLENRSTERYRGFESLSFRKQRMIVANAILIPEIDRLLQEGHEVVFTPGGVSMRPFIEGGRDSVTLVRPETVAPGDIVLCEIAPEHYVLHRLIAMEGERLTLMGDGNLQGTEQCKRSNVIGKVTAIHRPRGRSLRPGKGRLWLRLLPVRKWLLKIYRKLILCRY